MLLKIRFQGNGNIAEKFIYTYDCFKLQICVPKCLCVDFRSWELKNISCQNERVYGMLNTHRWKFLRGLFSYSPFCLGLFIWQHDRIKFHKRHCRDKLLLSSKGRWQKPTLLFFSFSSWNSIGYKTLCLKLITAFKCSINLKIILQCCTTAFVLRMLVLNDYADLLKQLSEV